MTDSRMIRYGAIAVVLLFALVNIMVINTSNQAPDDAYISLRYADNLAKGYGLRFNPGKERVEGFSSPLHVLTMAAAIKIGFEPRAVSQFSSLSAALASILIIAVWGRLRFGLLWGTSAALALALSQEFSMWARSGMETTGFAMLVLLALITAAEGRWRTMGVLAGMLAITRPEGVLYWLPLFAFVVLVNRREKRSLRDVFPAVGLALALYLPWVLFRLAYFHDVFPNTYYAKMDGMHIAQVQRGLEYILPFMRQSQIQVSMLMFGLGTILYLVLGRRRPVGDRRPWQILGLGLIACTMFFIFSSGGDWMNKHRFLQPAVPILVLLGSWSGWYLGRLITHGTGRTALTVVLALVFLSQPLRIMSHYLRYPQYPLDRPLGLVEPWDDYNIPRLYKLGQEMRRIMPADATIALCPAGAFPFACERTVIDMLGLNDREIARVPLKTMGQGDVGHEKGNGRLILARKPDFILLRGRPNPEVGEISPPDYEVLHYVPVNQIWNDESFHEDYEPFVLKIDEKTSFTVYRRITLMKNPEDPGYTWE